MFSLDQTGDFKKRQETFHTEKYTQRRNQFEFYIKSAYIKMYRQT